MIGRFYIDDMDCSAVFGLSIAEGSFAQVVSWPSLKDVEATDWHEENGIEPDLDAPALDSREFSIRFVGSTQRDKVDKFVSMWRTEVYRTLRLNIGRSYKLRLTGSGKPRWVNGLCILDMRFADDFPLNEYVYARPASAIAQSSDYILDGRRLTDYGVIVLEGAHDKLLQTPEVKDNLITSFAAHNGIDYDGEGAVTYGAYEAQLTCLMRAESLDELWANYDALLYDLVRPGGRKLTATDLGTIYTCHYVSSRVRRFFPEGKIWLEFDISLNVYEAPVKKSL